MRAMQRVVRTSDPLVQELFKLASRSDVRGSKKRCVVAGTKLVQELGRRHTFHELLMPESEAEQEAASKLHATERHIADARSLRRIARLSSFEGLVATVDLPQPLRVQEAVDPRLVLALDYIEDPGLLGTLLRAAWAFEWQAVFFLPNCVDPFHPKCIRASQGALFEVPFFKGKVEDLQKLCRRNQLSFCVSNPAGVDLGSPDYDPPPNGLALLLREEYACPWGPPKEAFKVTIPSPPGLTDDDEGFDPRSLDVAVAGGILMHHIKHFHYPHFSPSANVASPKKRRR